LGETALAQPYAVEAKEVGLKTVEAVMEILEAFDLTQSMRAAAELAGCDHHTVGRYVAMREQGRSAGGPPSRPRLVDPYLDKVEEWVERSRGNIRADVVHDRLRGLGYTGGERTTRRAVQQAKQAWKAGHRRIYRPWIPEPGMWFQWDWGSGPRVDGRSTVLFCAWLAWSRYRVVLPAWDKTLPTLIACLDQGLRAFGGAPTYGLTDNEQTVTTVHLAGLPVRHPELVAASRYYGITVATCLPADPETKGGAEATVRVAKADLVPTEANLREEYGSFGALEEACAVFCREVNRRPHRETGRPPEALLHPLPEAPYTAAFGQTRSVSRSCLISVGGVRYSVPYTLVDETVWVREHGDQLVIVQVGKDGPREVARHRRSTPGRPQVKDAHYPPRSAVHTLGDRPRPTNPGEEVFLAIGPGARTWLVAAAATGAARLPTRMLEIVALAKLHGDGVVDRALHMAAQAGRFTPRDVASILIHGPDNCVGEPAPAWSATEVHSLQPGTGAWGVLR
jgi:transposase